MNNSECVMVFGIHVLEPSEIRPATEMGNSGEFPFQAGHRPPTAPGDIAGSCLPLGDPFWPCSRAILVHSGGRFSFRYAARHSRAPGGPRSPGAVPNALVRAQGSGEGEGGCMGPRQVARSMVLDKFIKYSYANTYQIAGALPK